MNPIDLLVRANISEGQPPAMANETAANQLNIVKTIVDNLIESEGSPSNALIRIMNTFGQ
jgi:hypothetical protein